MTQKTKRPRVPLEEWGVQLLTIWQWEVPDLFSRVEHLSPSPERQARSCWHLLAALYQDQPSLCDHIISGSCQPPETSLMV